LRECETQIESCLRRLEDKSKGATLPASMRKRRRQPEKNEVRFGARELLFKMAGVDLTVLEGISETTALVILSEIGTDMSQFPHEKNFVSWLGLCPQHRGSAGKIFKRRTRRGANRAARAIARSLKISRQRASYIFARAMRRQLHVCHHEAELIRKLELDRLDAMMLRAWTIMDAGGPPETTLRAIDRLLGIQARRAKYLGLDEIPQPLSTEAATAASILPILKGATTDELMVFHGLIEQIRARQACPA
jgi:hypothetical protein